VDRVSAFISAVVELIGSSAIWFVRWLLEDFVPDRRRALAGWNLLMFLPKAAQTTP
jgi:hypothetical protein